MILKLLDFQQLFKIEMAFIFTYPIDFITCTGLQGLPKFDVTGGAGAQTITTGAALSTVDGGAGADTIILGAGNAVVDIVSVVATESTAVVAGATTAGTLSGYDNVTNFHLGDGVTNSDNLNVGGTGAIATTTGAQDGTDSALQMNTGNVIQSSSTAVSGKITFATGSNTYGSGTVVTPTTTGDVAAIAQYLATLDIGGAAGESVFFTATVGSTAHTYVWTQSSANAGGDFIDLVGVTATALITTNLTTGSALFIS